MNKTYSSNYKHHWLVAYDISSSSNRSKLHHLLQKVSNSYQKSFFEIITDESQIEYIANSASNLIDVKTDKLMIACTTKTLNTHRLSNQSVLRLNKLFIIK